MRGERLSQRVSAVTPLGEALDGTPVKRQRAPRKPTTAPPVGTTYACARCDYRTGDQREYMAHLRADIKELESELAEVHDGVPRDALGRRRVAECGTRSGHHRHMARREPACDACRNAKLADARAYKARRRAEDPVWREAENTRRRANKARRRAEQQQAGGED